VVFALAAGFLCSITLGTGAGSGSGAGAYGTVGVELLRSHHVGFVAAARVDAPFYSLNDSSAYCAPISLQFAMVFH